MTIDEMAPVDEEQQPTYDEPPMVLPRAPIQPRPVRRRIRPRTVKRTVAVVVSVLALYVSFERIIGPLIYSQRQEHLSASIKKPSSKISNGDAVAIIQAPAIDLNVVVVEGVDIDNLRGAPAHLAGSALPGDAGIMVVYGHRDTYGKPFARIDDLKNGDSIVAQARNEGPITRYIVDRVERDASVTNLALEKTDVISYLVLVTNSSKWTSSEETIVIARALPITGSDPVVPSLSTSLATGVPFGLDLLFAVGAGVCACLSWLFLRRRAGDAVRILVVAPMVVFALIRGFMALDSILPIGH